MSDKKEKQEIISENTSEDLQIDSPQNENLDIAAIEEKLSGDEAGAAVPSEADVHKKETSENNENNGTSKAATEEEVATAEDKIKPADTSDKATVEEDEQEEEVASSDDDEEDDTEEVEEVKDFHALSKKELVAELGNLLKNKSVQNIKNEVEEIRSEFNSKFNEELEHEKEEFLASGGNIIDFHYSTPLRKEFNSLYFDYRERRNTYFKNLKKCVNIIFGCNSVVL